MGDGGNDSAQITGLFQRRDGLHAKAVHGGKATEAGPLYICVGCDLMAREVFA